MTSACRRPGALAVLIAAAVIGLAACSGGSSSPQVASLGSSSSAAGSGGASAQPTGNPVKLLDEWAACMRKHGDPNQADPTIDSNKDIEITMVNVSQAVQHAVHGSTGPCSNYLLAAEKDLRGGQPAPTVSAAQELKFARCMRASGFPKWPDASANGETNLRAAGIDPGTPAVRKAAKACDSKAGIRYYSAGTEAPGVVKERGCSGVTNATKCPSGPIGGGGSLPATSGNGGSGANG